MKKFMLVLSFVMLSLGCMACVEQEEKCAVQNTACVQECVSQCDPNDEGCVEDCIDFSTADENNSKKLEEQLKGLIPEELLSMVLMALLKSGVLI